MASKSVDRFKQGVQMQQTDDRLHYEKMCRNRRKFLAVRAISPKNVYHVLEQMRQNERLRLQRDGIYKCCAWSIYGYKFCITNHVCTVF